MTDKTYRDLKRIEFLLKDSESVQPLFDIVNAMDCISIIEISLIYDYKSILKKYFGGQVNIYDVYKSIMDND